MDIKLPGRLKNRCALGNANRLTIYRQVDHYPLTSNPGCKLQQIAQSNDCEHNLYIDISLKLTKQQSSKPDSNAGTALPP